MNYIADGNPLLQVRKVEALTYHSPTERAVRGPRPLKIASLVSLLLTAACAHAQFGALPVGSSSGNQGIQVTATVAGTVSNVEVLSLGATSGDFAVGTGPSNCVTTFSAPGQQCTQSVTFAPVTSGLRLGAVVLTGTVGGVKTVLGATYLSGTGTGGLGVLVTGNVIPVAGQYGIFTGLFDGYPATQATLDLPGSAALDGAGNMYIADAGHNRIRMVCASANSETIAGTTCADATIISTIAGDGNPAYTGDGGLAVNATVDSPGFVTVDGAGNLYIADTGNDAIRMINAVTGLITTVAGNVGGTVCGAKTDSVGDGCPATQATLSQPQGVTLDSSGNIYIADTNDHRIREVNAATGVITTIAGNGFTNPNGTGGYNGDNIPAGTAELNYPYVVAFDPTGNMYIPDSGNDRIREVQATGGVVTAGSKIVTFAGTGIAAATVCLATPVEATLATVWSPSGVAVDAAGNVYIAETQNAAIRKVSSATGLISTLVQAGCGMTYFNGQFANWTLYAPSGLYLDGNGNLYIADTLDMVISEVQGNYVALDIFAPVRQGETSATQSQTVENDGNASLDLTTITAGTNALVDITVTNSCSNGQTLPVDGDCEVGAVFAPALTPVLTVNTPEMPNIDVGEDTQLGIIAPNSPLDIQLFGTAAPVTSTTTTVTSSPNPSGFGQSVTFTVTVTTGSGTGALTGSVSIADTFGGITSTLASGLVLNSSGVATFSISTLGVGVHSITASYDNTNDPAHMASTSAPPLIQTVLEGTAVSLVSSVNPSAIGQSVTFTATVTSSGGTVNPTGTVTFYDGSSPLSTLNINGIGVATYTTSTLANGVHQITAVYNGNPSTQVQGSTSNIVSQIVQAPSTITVVSSPNPSTYGVSVTFTAKVTSASASPATGTVNFLDNGVSIGTGTLSGSPGVATFSISTLVAGTHPITVTYAGDNYNAASASAAPYNQVVNQGSTVTTVSATPTPGIAGTSETITATVALASGAAPFTGTVTFTSGATTLGSAPLNALGVATITPTLAAGSYQIVATFSGDANTVGSASMPLPYTVALATTQTALTVAPIPAVILSPITFTATVTGNGVAPTGSVNFLANGVVVGTSTLSGGSATFTLSTLAAGSYTMTAEYLGNTTEATSTSPSVSETVIVIPTTTVLGTATTSGPNPQVVLVAAVINNSTGPEATGTVTFYNGTTLLGTAPLNAGGVATLTPNLANGTNYNIDAVYGGDADHSPSTSQTVSISGTSSGFTVTVTPATVTIPTGQNATVTVTLTSNGNFTDTVGLGCASLPAVVNCHFASNSLTLPANGTVSTQLTIDTNNPLSGGNTAVNRRPGSPKFSLAGLFLPLSLGFGCIFWRMRRRNARILTAALILVLAVAAFVATGCSFSQATAAPGTYVIQVTGTGATTNVIEFQNVNLDITK